jgi:hypothetical protein
MSCETTSRDDPTAKRAISSSLRRSGFPLRKLWARFWTKNSPKSSDSCDGWGLEIEGRSGVEIEDQTEVEIAADVGGLVVVDVAVTVVAAGDTKTSPRIFTGRLAGRH